MADDKKCVRGVVVEFDFTVIDGAQVLFETAKANLAEIGIDLDIKREALHLAGFNYQGGLNELFSVTGDRHDPAKAARELAESFNAAITAKYAEAVTPAFKAFVNALAAKGVKTVITTRGDAEALRACLEGLDPTLCVVFQETSNTYGSCKWDAWRRACAANDLRELCTVGVTGSGSGVRAVLAAGLAALAVIHPHTAYQDFGGADVAVEKVDAALAEEVFRMLHMA